MTIIKNKNAKTMYVKYKCNYCGIETTINTDYKTDLKIKERNLCDKCRLIKKIKRGI